MLEQRLRNRNVFAGLAIAVLTVFGIFNIGAAMAASGNDVIHGGIRDNADLIQKYRNGDGRNSAANIQKIFRQAIGVQNAGALTNLKPGHVHKNGNVTVDGRVVATEARSTGRHRFGDAQPLGNTGAHIGTTQTRFRSNSLPALVRMVDGEFHYAVIMNCGNPVRAKKVPKKVEEKPREEKKVIEKEVIKEVEKIVKVPVEKEVIVEKPVIVERVIEKEVEELPVTGFGGALSGLLGSAFLGVGVRGWVTSRRKLRDLQETTQ